MSRLLPSYLIIIQERHKNLGRLNSKRGCWILILLLLEMYLIFAIISPSHAWFDETHIAVAKVAGYPKYFNACGPT